MVGSGYVILQVMVAYICIEVTGGVVDLRSIFGTRLDLGSRSQMVLDMDLESQWKLDFKLMLLLV